MGSKVKHAINVPPTWEPDFKSLIEILRPAAIQVSTNPYTAVGIYRQSGRPWKYRSMTGGEAVPGWSKWWRGLLRYILERYRLKAILPQQSVDLRAVPPGDLRRPRDIPSRRGKYLYKISLLEDRPRFLKQQES
jgi:hypothetical protein